MEWRESNQENVALLLDDVAPTTLHLLLKKLTERNV